MNDPSIVPVYEVGRNESFPYIVTEFVAGISLSDALTGRRFTFRESAEIVAQVADALDHTHRQGVVHRDLKPSNIMIREVEGRVEALLMDFGLARREEGEVTMTTEGQVLGTPAYMSPEQARGEGHRADGRSDIYGLGAILYELLVSTPPFRGNVRMLLYQVLNSEPQPPRRLNDRIPQDLETISLKCLQKEPSKRYPTAGALAEDLRRFLDGKPILRVRWVARRGYGAGRSATRPWPAWPQPFSPSCSWWSRFRVRRRGSTQGRRKMNATRGSWPRRRSPPSGRSARPRRPRRRSADSGNAPKLRKRMPKNRDAAPRPRPKWPGGPPTS